MGKISSVCLKAVLLLQIWNSEYFDSEYSVLAWSTKVAENDNHRHRVAWAFLWFV